MEGCNAVDGRPPIHTLEKRVRWITLGTVAVLFTAPCAAAALSAAAIKKIIIKEAAECSSESLRLRIERLAIVGAREHNRVRRGMRQETDGREGQHYVMVVARHGKQVASVASLGPVEPTVRVEDLNTLRGTVYCDRSIDSDN